MVKNSCRLVLCNSHENGNPTYDLLIYKSEIEQCNNGGGDKEFQYHSYGRIKKLPDNHCAKRIYQFIRFAEQDNQIQSIQFSISKVYLDNNY